MSIYTTIRAELDGNVALYGAMTDQQVTDELNAVDKQQNRTSMSGDEILSNIEGSALATLTGDNAVKVMGIVGMGSVDPFGPAAQIFIDAFGGGSATITALQAARVETVSRASQIGVGVVKLGDVMNARAL